MTVVYVVSGGVPMSCTDTFNMYSLWFSASSKFISLRTPALFNSNKVAPLSTKLLLRVKPEMALLGLVASPSVAIKVVIVRGGERFSLNTVGSLNMKGAPIN